MEVLVATAVMVPLILAASMGLVTGLRASADAERVQRLQVALTTATEDLKVMPYLPCGTAKEYQELYRTWSEQLEPDVIEEHRNPVPVIDSVAYWDEASASYVDRCEVDGGTQQFRLVVIIDGRNAEGTIVTRDPGVTVEELRR